MDPSSFENTPTRDLSLRIKRMRLQSMALCDRLDASGFSSDGPPKVDKEPFHNRDDSFNLSMESEPGSPLIKSAILTRDDSLPCSPLIMFNERFKLSISSIPRSLTDPTMKESTNTNNHSEEGSSEVFAPPDDDVNDDSVKPFTSLLTGQMKISTSTKRKLEHLTASPKPSRRNRSSGTSSPWMKRQRPCGATPKITITGDTFNFNLTEPTNAIGNFQAENLLPTVVGPSSRYKYIEPKVLRDLLCDGHQLVKRVEIIDARYAYEFRGGYIKNASNIISQGANGQQLAEKLLEKYFTNELEAFNPLQRRIMIFHCEFSSERGPRMLNTFRKMDRSRNLYPSLHWPEIYLLRGGFKAYWDEFKNDSKKELVFGVHGYTAMLADTNELHQIRKMRRKARTAPNFQR